MTIDLNMYDNVADDTYSRCDIGDMIWAYGKIGKNMKIEILHIEVIQKQERKK